MTASAGGFGPTERRRCLRHSRNGGIADTITILRAKYPDALICTACGLLLATQRASYAKSNPTEEQRLAYVCAAAPGIRTSVDLPQIVANLAS